MKNAENVSNFTVLPSVFQFSNFFSQSFPHLHPLIKNSICFEGKNVKIFFDPRKSSLI